MQINRYEVTRTGTTVLVVIVPCTLESKHRTVYIEYEYRVHNEGKHPNDLPDCLTCLLRNLYSGQEATVRTGHRTDCSKLGKEYVKAVYCQPTNLTYMDSTSC